MCKTLYDESTIPQTDKSCNPVIVAFMSKIAITGKILWAIFEINSTIIGERLRLYHDMLPDYNTTGYE
jgi:hypothetical protein